jgi:hypothetical protein
MGDNAPMTHARIHTLALVLGIVGILAPGCGGGSGGGSTPCPKGDKGCACYPNVTCNGTLVCASNICVQVDGEDAAQGGVQGSGGSGAGGMIGVGGMVGAGGISSTLATGGALGVGGSPALGGAPGTGGSPVVDGAPGAGGSPVVDAAPGTGGSLVGAGGSPAIDGSFGTGGAPGTGGTPGTGGAPGTGGVVPIDAAADAPQSDTSTPVTELPALYDPCSTLGALNCLGHAQKAMIMCDGTRWVPNGACAGTLVCDTTPGPSQGTCAQPIAACAGQQPGYSYCTGNSKITCGPDIVNISAATCPFVCTAGQCTGECVPTSVDCSGNVPVSCGYNGMWLRGTACPYDCNKGTCCGISAPNVCGSVCVNSQTNNLNCGGCGNVCPTTGGKSCQTGFCQCPVGTTDCSGTCVYLASSSANCGACGNACVGGRTCQAGACACPSATTDCSGTCANLQSDGANCGVCGLSCGGASCFAGNCGGGNLILNGDFSSGATYWTVTQATLGTTSGTSGGGFCVSLPTYGTATLGWPDALNTSLAVPLGAGYTYTLSYTVSTTSPLYSLSGFNAKVGHAITPYTAAFSTYLDNPGPAAAQFTHDFTPSYADTGAGIAFTILASSPTTVCFDDVALVRH